MGINGLWDVLGKGEEYAIADYAAAHWEKYKRPLRIAVDEACWRFNNLTEEQVARIREGEPAANPIEKTILWRILNLWKMNIQLLFVTDGLKKPGKKRWGKKAGGGRGGSKVDKEVIKLLHKMFDRLHVPYHMAPGEAEAECARLQQLGVVDAVWSDDGDCLMFGCTTLIKAHRNAQKKKEWDRIEVYEAQSVLPNFDFDTDSLVMFAVVAGGDYDEKGLPDCGTQKSKLLCRRGIGLARTLRQCESKYDFDSWRQQLATTILEMRYAVTVPSNFPDLKALNGYRDPAVSTADRCRNLRGLHGDKGGWEWWETQMDQNKLRDMLRSHYNFQTREYLKHLGPVFLARTLTRDVRPARREENLSYGVALRRTQNRKNADGEDIGQPSEINIKFNPAMLVQIDLSVQPLGEDWSCTVKNDGVQYDPMKPIDGVMMSCFLEHGLPEGALEKSAKATPKSGRKSKGIDVLDDLQASESGPAASQQSPTARKSRILSTSIPADLDAYQSGSRASQPKATSKRKARFDITESPSKPVKKSKKPKTAERTPSISPPLTTFKRLQLPNLVTKKSTAPVDKVIPDRSLVIDLDDDSDGEAELCGSSPARIPAAITTKAHAKQGAYDSQGDAYPTSMSAGHGQSSYAAGAIAQAVSSSLPPASAWHTTSASQKSRPNEHGIAPTPLPPSFMAAAASSVERIGPHSSPAAEDLEIVPSAASLRQRREVGLLSKLSKPAVGVDQISKLPVPTPEAPPVAQYEVIDLT